MPQMLLQKDSTAPPSAQSADWLIGKLDWGRTLRSWIPAGYERALGENPPTFWWPTDRTWFAVCDIDAASTYIGGSKELIEKILNDPALEAFPADLNDSYDGLYVSKTAAVPIKRRVSRTELFRENAYRLLFRLRFRLRRKPSSGGILYQKKRFWEWRIRP